MAEPTAEHARKQKIKGYKAKERTFRNLGYAGIAGVFLGVTLLVSSYIIPRLKVPKIAERYDNAQITLTNLQERRTDFLAYKVPPLYETPAVLGHETPETKGSLDKALDTEKQELAQLDGVIASVEEDIFRMRASPVLAEYQDKKKKTTRDFMVECNGGMGLFFLGMISSVIATSIKEKYRAERERLEQQPQP